MALFVPHLRQIPLTVAYVALLLGAWAVISTISGDQARFVVSSWSTDIAHLSHNPVKVLVLSVFVSTDAPWWVWAPELLWTLGPVEQIVGTRRMLVLAVMGHLTATISTEMGLLVAHTFGWLPHVAFNRVDVGPSYALMAVLAAVCYLLPNGWWRALGYSGAGIGLILPLLLDWGLAPVGHVVAFTIGSGLAPLLCRSSRRRAAALVRSWTGAAAARQFLTPRFE